MTLRSTLALLLAFAATLVGATTPVSATDGTDHPRAISPEARGLVNLGNNLTDRNDYAAAEIAFRQVLNSSAFTRPEHQEALIGLARMHRRQGSFTKAAAIYERFIKDYPEDGRMPDVLLDLGRTLRAMGAHRLALSRFYSVLNSTLKLPADAFDHYQLLAKTAQFEIAETHFEAGNYAEAGKFFSRLRLLDLAPVDRARAHFKSAYSAKLGGDDENAVRILRDFLGQWPLDENVPEARNLLALTLRQLGRHEEALAATFDLLRTAQLASAADPKRWSYWQRRTGNQLANEFFAQGDTPNALAIYQALATLAQEPAWRLPVLYQVALCYERLRAIDRAKETYTLIIEGAKALPDNPELNELAKMAVWRITHLDWTHVTERQLNSFFASTTGQPGPAKPIFPSGNESSPGPAAPPTDL
jgi:tetratricopeptide (TPR) repeat protein